MPKKIKGALRKAFEARKPAMAFLKRKSRKMKRLFGNEQGKGYTFAITCVKKPVYIRMAIDNANSLHYLNANHSFVIYADAVCHEEFKRLRHKLDYPARVECHDDFGTVKGPWQYCKVETIIDAGRKGFVFTDADGIWHDEPRIDPEKITILVLAYAIKDKPLEKRTAEALFKEQGAVDLNHYVLGFLFVPPSMMTEALANDIQRFSGILLEDPLAFLESEEDRRTIHRLADELGVSIALQTHYKDIRTLKQNDGPKSRELLQSLYYGCKNDIIS